MSNLSKKDFEAYFGKNSLYSEEDKKKFFNRVNKTSRKRHLIPQLLTAALLLGFLAIGISLIKDGSLLLTPGDKSSHELEIELEEMYSLAEIEKYYEDLTPGLARASELGLVTNINKTIPIKDGYKIHIDRIWYTSEDIHMYYSIELPGRRTTFQDGIPTISNIQILEDPDAQYQELNFDTYDIHAVTFNNRIYDHVALPPLLNDDLEPISKLEELVAVKLTAALPNEDYYELDEVQIPINYDQGNESKISTPIDETIPFPGGTINLHTFEMGTTKNRMYGTVELEDDINILNGDGTIDIGGDNPLISLYFYNEDPDSNTIIMESEAFNQVPDDITITINNIHLYGNDSYQFSIDISELNDSATLPRKDMRQKITEIKDTTIFLDRASYTEDGLQFTIVYEAKKENQPIELASYSINEYLGEESADFPNLITARNNNGDIGKVLGGSIAEGIFSQTYLKSFAESSEYIDVTMENLLYLVRVDESVNIKLINE
ncbi:hypothetical protein [Paucisalibacillus sp. EB02]|uniref:hypothetical protein n=1 Tax=Paucisalibacillus sp. EB02 TaxID=1347087 RepID=UPI0004AF168E|nr:hypothetical protein [Paucisalibacillus sp. EB02]